MKKLLSNSSGFTLVELMVVVAIIGILSAVAIPNFKRYQAKSKQSEAKIQLAAIYSAEVSTAADYDTFATCIGSIGYDRTQRGYYTVGFETGFDASARFGGCDAAQTAKWAPAVTHLSANGAAATALPASTASQLDFIAGASGQISTTSTTDDQWTINQVKNLQNTTQSL